MKRVLLSFLVLALMAGGAWAATREVPAVYGTIQAAIAAADPGDVVNIAAGTYREQLYINKDLSLVGAGSAQTIVEAPDPGARATFGITTWTGSARTVDAVIGAVAANVFITGLKVDGRDTGPDNFYGIYYHECSGAVTYCTVAGVTYPAGAGAQRVVSMSFSHGAGAGPFTVDVSNNAIPTFQKGGIYVGGPKMIFTVNGNDVDANPTPSIAGNGIQLSYGATGTTNGNTVTGVGYTGIGWAGAGILLFESGDVTMTGDTVIGSQTGVNYSDWRWVYSHPVPVNLTFNGLTLTDNEWSFGAQLSGNQSDLNLVMNNCEITGSTADAIDVWGTGVDPWGGSYYAGWNNGDLNVTINGLVLEDTAVDGVWTADLSGYLTNVLNGFSIHNSSFTNTTGKAVSNSFTVAIDATRNYWGSPAGPTPAAKSGGTRLGAPLTSPAGFDLPKDGQAATVPASAADKAAGTISGLVTFSPWYGLPLGSIPMAIGTNSTIQAAIDAANPGDIIAVAAGTYNEGLTIGKNVTILGPNAALSPNTAAQVAPAVLAPLGNTHAIQGTAANVSVTVKGMYFDLAGTNNDWRFVNLINQANNTWTFEHNVFANARKCNNGNWYLTGTLGDLYFNLLDNLLTGSLESNGIALWGNGVNHVDIRENVFRDNGGWGLNLNNVHGTISNNLFTDTALTGPNWSDDQSGMIIASANNDVVVSGNTFNNLGAIGVSIYDGFDGVLTGTGNTFIGCATAGVRVRPGALDLSGVAFSGNTFSGNAQGALNSTVLVLNARNNWWGAASGPYHATANPGGTGDPVSDYVDFAAWSGMATASATPATSGPINCSQNVVITFRYTPDTMSPPMFGYNAVVKASPEVAFGTLTNMLPFGLANSYWYTVDNGVGVDGYHRWTISGTTLATGGQPVTGPADLFSIQFLPVSSGTAAIAVESLVFRDPSNNTIPTNLPTASILIDCTNPAVVTAITAAPGHNKVNVGWAHNGADAVSYEVYRGLWYDTSMAVSAYPEYDDLAGDVIPTRPLSRADAAAPGSGWQLAGTKLVAEPRALEDLGPFAAGRGVYYYEVFAIDAANNASAVATMTARPRATNYWLGDVDGTMGDMVPNGLVNSFDMTVLAVYFGVSNVPLNSAGSPVDVGPTDNFSRVGIPQTDSEINFEDLMVFAMNFGVVSAAKVDVPVAKSVDLAWVQYDDGSQALRLVNGTGLKGVRVTANVPVTSVTAGSLLDQQSELTFLRNVGETLDASVAVMGVNTTFTGSGDLFVIAAGAAITAEDLTIVARAIDNSRMDVAISGETGGQAMPRVFALNAAYPNPFNPMTKISFSLPEAQAVRLTVYGLDGRKVATLADGTFAAGLHEVVWTGRDDVGQGVASGTYIYRIDAGPYSDVRKMTLMK